MTFALFFVLNKILFDYIISINKKRRFLIDKSQETRYNKVMET